MKLNEVVKGGEDQRGRPILDIYWSTKDYVIFRHSTGISPHFSDDELRAENQRKAYGKIGPMLSEVNALRSCMTIKTSSIDREIARAVSQALDENIQSAQAILVTVKKRLLGLISIKGRLQYQLSALVFILLSALLYWLAGGWFTAPAAGGTWQIIMLVALCGAVGGFLSVSMSIRKLEIDPESDWKVNALAGASRIVIAVIGSVFIYFAIKSKLILGNIDLLSQLEGLYAVAIAAGFSESLVPNVLKKVSQTAVEQKADDG